MAAPDRWGLPRTATDESDKAAANGRDGLPSGPTRPKRAVYVATKQARNEAETGRKGTQGGRWETPGRSLTRPFEDAMNALED